MNDDSFSFYTIVDLHVDEASCLAVAEFITRANYDLRAGCFEMDFSDGEVRYRTHHHVGEDTTSLTADQIRHAIYVNVSMVERYGNALMAVMMGFQTPEEAIAQAKAD